MFKNVRIGGCGGGYLTWLLKLWSQIRAATDRSVACSVAAGIRHRPAISPVPGRRPPAPSVLWAAIEK